MLEKVFQPSDQRSGGAGISSFILCPESIHIFLLCLRLVNSLWQVDLVLASLSLDWAAFIMSSVMVGILNLYLFRSGSSMISSVGLAILLGAALVAASIIMGSPALASMTVVGVALMSGGVLVGVGLQLRNAKEFLHTPIEHAAVLLLTFLLSPLLVMMMYVVGSLLPIAPILPQNVPLNAVGFVEGAEIRLYPYTVVLFVILATQPLWMPVLVKLNVLSFEGHPDSTVSIGVPTRIQKTLRWRLLLLAAVAVGVIVTAYRLVAGYPLTGDAHYYLSTLQQMDRLGVRHALSTDRPMLFLVLNAVKVSLSIEPETLLGYLQVVLTCALTLSTYAMTSSYFKDERLAVLSALLASFSSHVTVGIKYFIVGNWLALILLMLFCAALLRSYESRSRQWVALTICLSWLILGIHFPTWVFGILVLMTYSFASLRAANNSPQGQRSLTVKIAIGYLLAVLPALLLGLIVPEMSGSLQSASSRVVAYLTQMSPLNIVHFLRDEVLLSSYFATGCYAIPLTYALSLLGLHRLYHMRGAHVRVVLSWMAVACLSIIAISKFEPWRLLYMMPLEILAAKGLLRLLESANLVGGICTVNGGDLVSRRSIALTVGLLLSGAIALVAPTSFLILLLAYTMMGWYLSYDLGHGQVRQIVSVEIVLLYAMAGLTNALYSLR